MGDCRLVPSAIVPGSSDMVPSPRGGLVSAGMSPFWALVGWREEVSTVEVCVAAGG